MADGGGACQACELRFLWPWIEDCWFCEQAVCGFATCEIREYAPGDDYCVGQGEGCGEGLPGCEDPHVGSLLPVGATEQVKLADCERVPFLSETWRLKSVQLVTHAKPRQKRA